MLTAYIKAVVRTFISIRSQRLSHSLKKARPNPMWSFKYKDTGSLKVKRCKNIYHANYEHKEAGMTILPLDKIVHYN